MSKNLGWAAVAVLVFGLPLAGCGGEAGRLQAFLQEPRRPVSATEYRVYPPDVLSVTSLHVPEIDRVRQQVRPDGKINIPLIGEISVAGMTPKEIETLITQAARDYYEQVDATVEVASYLSQKFYVFGQVSSPGAQAWTGNDSLLDALARSQPTTLAWPEKIRLVRGKPPKRGGYLPDEEVKKAAAATPPADIKAPEPKPADIKAPEPNKADAATPISPILAPDVVVARHNAWADSIQRLSSRAAVTVNVAAADPNQPPVQQDLDGQFSFEKPDRLSVRAQAKGQEALAIGMNAEKRWLWMPSRADTVWVGSRAGAATGRMPVAPEDLMTAMGLFPVAIEGGGKAEFLVQPRYYVLTEKGGAAAGLATATPWPAGTAPVRRVWFDRQTLRPARVGLYDEDGRCRMMAELLRYERIGDRDVCTDCRARFYGAEEVDLAFRLSDVDLDPRELARAFEYRAPPGAKEADPARQGVAVASPAVYAAVAATPPADAKAAEPKKAEPAKTGAKPADAKDTQVKNEVLTIDLMAMLKEGNMSQNVLLLPDDVIYVPANPLAEVGLAIQQVLFPLRPATETISTPTSAARMMVMP